MNAHPLLVNVFGEEISVEQAVIEILSVFVFSLYLNCSTSPPKLYNFKRIDASEGF